MLRIWIFRSSRALINGIGIGFSKVPTNYIVHVYLRKIDNFINKLLGLKLRTLYHLFLKITYCIDLIVMNNASSVANET